MSSEADFRGALYRFRLKEKRRAARPESLNDADRSQWIDNDEGLYDWWKQSRLPKREFIRQNRAAIDQAINPVVTGDKPAHHLKYGG